MNSIESSESSASDSTGTEEGKPGSEISRSGACNDEIPQQIEDSQKVEAISKFLGEVFQNPNVREFEKEFRRLIAGGQDIGYHVTDNAGQRTVTFVISQKTQDLYRKAVFQRKIRVCINDRISKTLHDLERVWSELTYWGLAMRNVSSTANPTDSVEKLKDETQILLQDAKTQIEEINAELQGDDYKKDSEQRRTKISTLRKLNSKKTRLEAGLLKVIEKAPRLEEILIDLRELSSKSQSGNLEELVEDDPKLLKLGIHLFEKYPRSLIEESLLEFQGTSFTYPISVNAPKKIEPKKIEASYIAPQKKREGPPDLWTRSIVTRTQLLFIGAFIAAGVAVGNLETWTKKQESAKSEFAEIPVVNANAPQIDSIRQEPAFPSVHMPPDWKSVRALAKGISCKDFHDCFDKVIRRLVSSAKDPFNPEDDYVVSHYAMLLDEVLKNNAMPDHKQDLFKLGVATTEFGLLFQALDANNTSTKPEEQRILAETFVPFPKSN